MEINVNKPGEFQERLILSQPEAKHNLIFLVYIAIYNFFIKCGRSTTSRCVINNNNSTMSTRGLKIYFANKSFNKTTIQLIIAWLCFLLYENLFLLLGFNKSKPYKGKYVCYPQIYNNTLIPFQKSFGTTKRNFSTNTVSIIRSEGSLDSSLDFPKKNNAYLLSDEDKALHSMCIKDLYKDREASLQPFHRDLLIATCCDILDDKKKSAFLKEWGSKSCIYHI